MTFNTLGFLILSCLAISSLAAPLVRRSYEYSNGNNWNGRGAGYGAGWGAGEGAGYGAGWGAGEGAGYGAGVGGIFGLT